MDATLVGLGIVAVEAVAAILCARVSLNWLYGFMLVNLILVTLFGGELIEVLGHVTNAANAFYAFVFIASWFIVEAHGKRAGYRSIGGMIFLMIFFVIIANIAILRSGASETRTLELALHMIFSSTTRVVVASTSAFAIALYTNIAVFSSLRERGQSLFMASTLANVSGQFLDSIVFFSIAFLGTLPSLELLLIMLVGYAIKIIVGLMGTALLYLDRSLRET